MSTPAPKRKAAAPAPMAAAGAATPGDTDYTINSFVTSIDQQYHLQVPTANELLPGTIYFQMWSLPAVEVTNPSPNVPKMAQATTSFPSILPQLGTIVFIQVRQASITAISVANPTVITSPGHGLSTGNIIPTN